MLCICTMGMWKTRGKTVGVNCTGRTRLPDWAVLQRCESTAADVKVTRSVGCVKREPQDVVFILWMRPYPCPEREAISKRPVTTCGNRWQPQPLQPSSVHWHLHPSRPYAHAPGVARCRTGAMSAERCGSGGKGESSPCAGRQGSIKKLHRKRLRSLRNSVQEMV